MMESLTINPVTSVESIIVSEAAAILENANKRRRVETPTSTVESSIVEVVMETPITMATTTSSTNSNGCSSPKDRVIANGTPNRTSPQTQQNHQQNQQHSQQNQQQNQQSQQQTRFIPFDNCKTEQIALLTALSQVVSCTQEAVKILRESQERSLDLEHKRFRFQLEAEEKRLMMESEHYRKMETMFSGLIQAISQTPTPTTPAATEAPTEIRASPTTVKLEVDS